MRQLTLFVIVAAFLVACGAPSVPPVEVTAAEYGDEWPFVVDKVTLRCIDGARILDVGGIGYALNGKALRSGLNAPPADLFKNRDVKSLGAFTEKAGAICSK